MTAAAYSTEIPGRASVADESASGRVAILVSTIDGGIDRIAAMLLPEAEDVCYVVSHQYTAEEFLRTPEGLLRPDVRVSHIPGPGVARSRNHALDLCPEDAAVALFADDDGQYRREYIDRLKELFAAHPELEVACLRIETYEGEPPYNAGYFSRPTRITDTYQLSVATPELACRPQAVRRAGVRFDERFGAGAGFVQFADENVFVHDCIRAGLGVWSYPQAVVKIHYENTIKRMAPYDARRVRALGAMDQRVRGSGVAVAKALWFSLRYAPRIRRAGASPWRYLCDRLSGVRYMKNRKRV